MSPSDEPDCARTRELLPRRLDDDLAPGELAAVERHLAGCVSCREEASLLGRAAEALRHLPEDERRRLRERTYRELGIEDELPSRGRSRWASALLFVVAFGLVYAWLRTRSAVAPSVEPVVPAGTSTR